MGLLVRFLAVLFALGPAATSSLAADFDCPRVTVIVPYPAGGAADVAARLVADRLELGLKKSFVIENRPGATGNIGTAVVVNARPTAAPCWSMPLSSPPFPGASPSSDSTRSRIWRRSAGSA